MQYVRESLSQRNIPILTAVSALGVATGYYMWRRSKLQITGEFHDVGRVKEIHIFPIKSLPGIVVDSAFITDSGLEYGPIHDRSFILQKEESEIFITLRQEPSLALLKLSLDGNTICIDGPKMNTLRLQVKTSVGENDIVRTCRVYGQDVKGIDCGDEVNKWFQSYLGKPGFRLLQFVPSFKPRRLINNLLNQLNPGKMVYHDDSTFHILSEASVNDLNERLVEKISHLNFRPNFLLSECSAFAEDNMKIAKVGDAILLHMAPCSRCILTTVNPETGVKTEKEPLTTLRTYRLAPTEELRKKFKNSPLFGVYMGVRKEGTVSVGDRISATPLF